ncbi:MAG: nucleotidyltransferase domain-containing protein [Nitrososphaera sp.]|nr:nucleotidyltransferase domain-containing protein [Nitrososphaera sp.]
MDRLFRGRSTRSNDRPQHSLELAVADSPESTIDYPSKSVAEFLNFISDALPHGDLYLFGGVLRDMALLGRRGFNSDIDLVVEGDWYNCVAYLESLGARRNKFGGYRLEVAGWPIDIWNAEETWAIRRGLVAYKGIASLTETTVLNWDAILMNWRTRAFVYRENYLEAIKLRVLDIVLEENPNPLGMAVRVLRHLCLKDARKISVPAARYLANCAKRYSFDEIRSSEVRSFGGSVINPAVYRLFEHLKEHEDLDIRRGFTIASDTLKKELGPLYEEQLAMELEFALETHERKSISTNV